MKSNACYQDQISNGEVERVLVLRETRDSLKKRLELLEDSLNQAEIALIQRIDHGASINCSYSIGIKETERRFPSWKEEFINAVGKQAADKVLQDTEPKVYRNLIIK